MTSSGTQTSLDFSQDSENCPAEMVIIHPPQKEIFMSILHPAASLYENVTEEGSVSQCFRNLQAILQRKGVVVKTVSEVLQLNRAALEELAFESLTYEPSDNEHQDNKQYQYYLSDEYKKVVLGQLWTCQLIDVVLTQPTYKLKYVERNTFVEPVSISFRPLGNLLFCRDQQITTRKGVVMGRAPSTQREIEHKIMEQVFKNLTANIIGKIPEGSYLEGGDFFVAKEDLSMLGVGLRTNISGAEYLMREDLLGTDRFAVVHDDSDLDQQRMHLDTFFNIVTEKHCVVLDFEETSKIVKKNIERKVYLYSKSASAEDEIKAENFSSKVGKYHLVKVFDSFYSFLESEGYTLIKITCQQQIEYMINFLNIGNNTILTVNPNLKNVLGNIGVEVIFVEFQAVMNMFGALHCATQVSRKKIREEL